MNQEDLVALTALAHGYATAIDASDGVALAALFTADGRLTSRVTEPPRTFAGEGIPAVLGELAAFDRTLHEIVAHRFTATADGARGELETVAHHLRMSGNGGVDLILTVAYADRYRYEDGRWLIAEREVRLVRSERRELGTPGSAPGGLGQ